jgi:aryl-alcohol dehydrogenase-like predicted oxidoreductase
VHAAIDADVTLLDTAEMYGNEELVGRASAWTPRRGAARLEVRGAEGGSGRFDDWSVTPTPPRGASCEGSLRPLGVNVIDLYYLHHRSEVTPIKETVTAMAELVATGKIRAIGLSNVTVGDVRRAHAVRYRHFRNSGRLAFFAVYVVSSAAAP